MTKDPAPRPDPDPTAAPQPAPSSAAPAPPIPADAGPATRTISIPSGGPLVALAALALVLLTVLALREVADLVVPVVFGLFLALVTAPLIGRLERRGARRSVALTITVLLVLVIVGLTIGVIALSAGELVMQVPKYQAELTDELAAIRTLLADLGINTDPGTITEIIKPEQVMTVVRPLAAAVSSAGAAIFILAFTLIYALTGAGSMRSRAEQTFGADHPLIRGVEQFGVDLRRYLVVRAQLGLFAGVLAVVLLFVLGVPYPLLWGVLVFAASFIPNVGFIIALIPPTILGFLDGGLVTAGLVIGGYVVINFLQDHLLQPVVMGSELNLSPLVVMLSVIAWAWILGAAGALLAVPLTVGLVAIMEAFPSTRRMAALLRNKIDQPVSLAPLPASDRPGATPAS